MSRPSLPLRASSRPGRQRNGDVGRRFAAPVALGALALSIVLAGCSGGSGAATGAGSTEEPPAATSADDRTAAVPATGPAPVTAPSTRSHLVVRVDGQQVPVTVVLPERYRSGRPAPLLLALPPGGQGRPEVDALLDRYWARDAQRRGWVVVSPEAPSSGLYISGPSAQLLPDLVAALERWYPPEGGRLHVAGVSNGGLSAWRFALDHPDAVQSLLTAPGYPPEPADAAHVGTLADVPVLLVVGGEDTLWRDAMEQTRDDLRAAGGQVRLIVSPGEGHIMEKVAPSTLWDFLDRAR